LLYYFHNVTLILNESYEWWSDDDCKMLIMLYRNIEIVCIVCLFEKDDCVDGCYVNLIDYVIDDWIVA
jgi:hypothetical protein